MAPKKWLSNTGCLLSPEGRKGLLGKRRFAETDLSLFNSGSGV